MEHQTIDLTVLPFKRFIIGTLELTIISDGSQIMAPVFPMFGPYTQQEQIHQLLQEHLQPTGFVELNLQILLIRKGDRLIMIDSGLGNYEPTSGHLQEALKQAGINHSDITDIVLTHCHLDHIGGLVNNAGELVFPAAKLYVVRTEFDFWMAEQHDFSHCPMIADPKLLERMTAEIKRVLSIIQPALLLVNANDLLLDCLQLIPAPGHTPGHTLIHIFSVGEELLHVADLVHSDILLCTHPEWGFSFDTHFQQAAATRRRFLELLAEKGKRALAYHLGWPGLGRVVRKGAGFEWVPES